MISRRFLTFIVSGAAVVKASQAAWVEAAGLAALGLGLVFLQLAARRPVFRPLAWCAFGVTGLSMVVVFLRIRAGV